MKVPKSFKCKKCGDCCYSPRISKKEVKRIISKYKYKQEDFIEKMRNGFYYIKQKGKKCMFLKRSKNKKICAIYPLRPKVCRLYPTELGKRGSCKPKKLHFDIFLRTMRRSPRVF